ncbi:MAG: hypothetical protein KAR39_06735 [Thermoplasmata archaeon]|nr:hypothetical protein [Thermoplasmata archaeon]
MIGTVAVTTIFAESDGAIDPDTETWDSTRMDAVYDKILIGLDWWESQIPNGRLEFNIYTYGAQPTSYEPITRPYYDQSLWINEILGNLGYTSGDFYRQVRDLNNYVRSTYNKNWAYTIFVVDSLNDPDGSFEDGFSAYAFIWGGPFVMMTYDNNGWGIDRMDQVLAHETGHMFYATDEYMDPGEYSGYLNVRETDNSGCMMDTASWSLSAGTVGQIGWFDSDADGLLDPEDTIPNTNLDPYVPNPTTSSSLSYTGLAEEVPLENRNPKYYEFFDGRRVNAGNDVSINAIIDVQYRVDGGPWLPATASDGAFDEAVESFEFITASLSDGAHVIETRARNTVGNWETSYGSDTVTIDTVAPSTSSSLAGTIGANSWYISPVTVTLNAFDVTSGVQYTNYRIDGGSWQAYSGSFIVSANGIHTMEYYSVDNVGNVESTKSVQVKIDTVAPSSGSALSGTSGGNGWYTTEVTITLNASDVTSGVLQTNYRIDGGIWQTYNTPFMVTGDMIHTVEYYSVDNAGNIESTKSVQVKIDTVLPSTSSSLLGTLGTNGWYTTEVTITLSASDVASGVLQTNYRIDGGMWQTYNTPFMVTGDMIHTVEFYSVDNAGNTENTKSVQLKIDAVNPSTSSSLLGTLGTNGWYVSDVTITLIGSDGTSGVLQTNYRIDGGIWQVCGGPIVVGDNGIHTVEYYSMDNAGNAENIRSVQLKIDTGVPDTDSSFSGKQGLNEWYTGEVTITLNASDVTSGVLQTNYRIDGGMWQTYSTPFMVTGDMIHTVEYYSVDNAGNTENTKSVQLKIDTKPPRTGSSLSGTLGTNEWYTSDVTIALDASDVTSDVRHTSYRIDSGVWQDYSGMLNITSDGSHRIEFYSVDIAGNIESAKTLTLKIDRTEPRIDTLTTSDPGSDGTLTASSVTVVWTGYDETSGIERYEVALDDQSFWDVGLTTTHTFTGLDDGSHTVIVRIVDRAGNLNEKRTEFTIDTNPSSPNGLMGGVPLYLLILVTIVTVVVAMLLWRRKKKQQPTEQ